jgi:hypothetical protein
MKRLPCLRPLSRYALVAITLLTLVTYASASSWKEQVLYSFQGGSDGAVPSSGVVFDRSGNLYGTTYGGGADNCAPVAACGTVYELSPPARKGDSWTETVLYVFKGKQYNDGESPSGGVVLDKTGNVYGTTAYGGTGDCVLLGIKGGCGTFFELSPPKQKGGAWTETILYSFQSGNDGYFPWGTLTWDSKGNLYGATEFGGGKGNTCNVYFQYCGTVFKLSPPNQKGGAWTERVLHSFAGDTDGANPNGGLLLDSKGAIYGTTSSGGNQGCQYQGEVGCGTAFKLTPPTKKGGVWTQEQLHVFSGGNDGANPNGNLVLGKGAGDLYGTAGGGKESRGVVFRFAPTRGSRWVEIVIYNFTDGKDGLGPSAVIMDSSGNLYGPALGGDPMVLFSSWRSPSITSGSSQFFTPSRGVQTERAPKRALPSTQREISTALPSAGAVGTGTVPFLKFHRSGRHRQFKEAEEIALLAGGPFIRVLCE